MLALFSFLIGFLFVMWGWFRRIETVSKYRLDVLVIIYSQEDWEHLRGYMKDPSFNKMLFMFWRHPRWFYRNTLLERRGLLP